jgi:YVTN family beta-propeller protein
MTDDVGLGVNALSSSFTVAGAPGIGCALAGRTAAPVGSSVSFSPAGVTGADLQYAWNFGDGSSTGFSSNPNAVHTYAAPRHYPVILTVRSGTQSSTCSATQTVHTEPTATPPRSSGTLAFDAGRNRVWAVNTDANTVTVINAATQAKLFETAVGAQPQTVAQAPDGRLWVANAGSDSLSVLDPGSAAVVQTIPLGRGSRPFGVVFNPLGTAAYVTLQGTGTVVRLHPTSGAVQASLAVGPTPRGLAISGDSGRLLVTRYISPADRGEVIEVNPSAFSVARSFALAADPGPDTEAGGRGVPNFLSSITIQPDGKRAWVPSKKDNTLRGSYRDGQPLTFESTVRTIVSQLSLETNTEVLADRVDLNDRDMANAVVFSPLGDYAFISVQGTNQVEVMDAYTRQVSSGLVNVGRAPRGLLLTPAGRLYVQNFLSRTVSVHDVSGILNSTTNVATRLADIATVAVEPLSAQVLLGKQIFYNAGDRRMSRDKYISCASCHQDGGHDGRVMDFTDRGEGLRNTTVLNGRRGTGHGRVHWSGNFDEIQDFENDIRNGFGGTGFMTDAQFNAGTRSQPLGDRKAGLSAELDALAAYVGSLQSVGPSPYRNADGTLTAAALAGRDIFRGSGQCISCHSGADFTDSAAGVLHDVGTIKASSGKRLGGTLAGIDTPTLRGVWDSAPYLHDGSAATLLDVLTTANPGNRHGMTSGLGAAELQQLVAYLQQIDDTPEGPAGPVVSNLVVFDSANAANWSIASNLQVGNLQYGDRSYALTSVPAALMGATWLRTANVSRAYAGNPAASFSISQPASVYVAVDDRSAALPWLAGWANTGMKLVNNEASPKSFRLFQKSFPAGTVSLGPQNNGGIGMYTVIIR